MIQPPPSVRAARYLLSVLSDRRDWVYTVLFFFYVSYVTFAVSNSLIGEWCHASISQKGFFSLFAPGFFFLLSSVVGVITSIFFVSASIFLAVLVVELLSLGLRFVPVRLKEKVRALFYPPVEPLLEFVDFSLEQKGEIFDLSNGRKIRKKWSPFDLIYIGATSGAIAFMVSCL